MPKQVHKDSDEDDNDNDSISDFEHDTIVDPIKASPSKGHDKDKIPMASLDTLDESIMDL